jgi:beta-N-acetylhexosaminidase
VNTDPDTTAVATRRVPRRLRLALVATALITVPSGCGILGGGAGGGGSHSTAAGTASGSAVAVASSRPATSTRAPSPAAACHPEAVLSKWSLKRRAAQLVVVPVEEDAVLSVKSLVTEGAGGIILFGSEAPATMPADLAALRRAGGSAAPLVMVDEEGGEIQRMANLAGDMPWPRTMAATLTRAQTRALAERAGRRMRAAGVTMDLAPVLDLSDGPGPDTAHPDGPRSFSLKPSVAAAYGIAFARGLRAGGVIGVYKHFPGLGQATYNTDDGPASVPPLPVLKAAALRPFEAAIKAGASAVMVGNVTVPGLTGKVPATLSKAAITGVLRRQLGFGGLVLTDSLSALAVTDAGYSVPRAAALSIEAGADMVLFDSAAAVTMTHDVIASIVSAVSLGQLSVSRLDTAVQHVLAAKKISLCR